MFMEISAFASLTVSISRSYHFPQFARIRAIGANCGKYAPYVLIRIFQLAFA
jgi:hypothetical protein